MIIDNYGSGRGGVETKAVVITEGKLPITEAAISAVPFVNVPGFSARDNEWIHAMHKRLLYTAKHKNDSNEVLKVWDATNEMTVDKHGDETSVSAITFPLGMAIHDKSVVLMHNHPRGSNFSPKDIKFFIANNYISTITAVTNAGAVFVLHKSKYYSYLNSFKLYKRIVNDMRTQTGLEGYAFTERFLKLCDRGGIDYVESV